MAEQKHKTAAEAGITVEPNPNRVVVRVGGHVIADSTRALVMRAPGSASDQYIPREDVDMTRLSRSLLVTHCPYKGDASYWTIETPERTVKDAVWSYEAPRVGVEAIAGHLAFYANRVDSIEEQPATGDGGSRAARRPT